MSVAFRTASILSALAVCFLSSAIAQEEEARHRFGGDVFRAGAEIRIDEANIEDLYAAGESITLDAIVRESVHVAGRTIRVNRPIGDDLYVAGYSIDIRSAVGGDVTAAGYRLELGVDGSVGQDALMAGRLVFVRGPIAGDASLAGETIEISAPIAGSVEIRASEIRFTEDARIDGTLSIWSPNPIDVPAAVIAPGRVTAHLVEEMRSRRGFGGALFTGILIMLVFGAILAALFPQALARAQERMGARPWRSLLVGVAATSALFGAIFVLGASIVGIPLVPLIVVSLPIALLVGYLTSAHTLGRIVLRLFGTKSGAGRLAALGAIFVGVVVLALVGLIPIFGWVVAVLAVVLGIGAWCGQWFARESRVAATPSS